MTTSTQIQQDIETRVAGWVQTYADTITENYRRYHIRTLEGNLHGNYRDGSVHAFVDKKTGQVFKPASWAAPAKHVRYDLRIIREREFLFNPDNTTWAGGYLYLR